MSTSDRWTLPGVLAWVIHRTPEAIAKTYGVKVTGPDFGTPKHGKLAEESPPKTCFDVVAEALEKASEGRDKEDTTYTKPIIDARDDLKQKLEAGVLKAFGIAPGERTHKAIPKKDWVTISFAAPPSHPDLAVDGVASIEDGKPLYSRVYVLAKKVKARWPALDAPKAPHTRAQKAPSLDAAILAITTLWPDKIPTMRAQTRNTQINDWLKGNSSIGSVSPRTICHALKALDR